jgi:hypothetical protein
VERPQNTSAERVTIVVEPSAFARGNSGNILGPIRLRREAPENALTEFPEHEWTDFVVVILGWWVEGLSDLRRGAEQVLFRFMDGPLAFRVSPKDSESYRIHCVEERVNGETEHGVWISPKTDFESSLLAACSASLAECERRGWRGRGIDTLQDAVRSVRLRVAV